MPYTWKQFTDGGVLTVQDEQNISIDEEFYADWNKTNEFSK